MSTAKSTNNGASELDHGAMEEGDLDVDYLENTEHQDALIGIHGSGMLTRLDGKTFTETNQSMVSGKVDRALNRSSNTEQISINPVGGFGESRRLKSLGMTNYHRKKDKGEEKGTIPACARKLPPGDLFHAAVSGDPEWLWFGLERVHSPGQQHNKEGLTVLHVAAQHGRLHCMKLLLESCAVDVNVSCPRGRRPIHMALSPESKPNSYHCLRYLLQHGADHHLSTDEGLTPLHLAASEGLEECVGELIRVGANAHAHDNRGHTPFDLACLWGHRAVASVLKEAMWHKDKDRDVEKRQELQNLKKNMIRMHRRTKGKQKLARDAITKQKVSEWAMGKGLPCPGSPTTGLWALSHRCGHSAEPDHEKRLAARSGEMWNVSPNPSRPPPADISRSESMRIGVQPDRAADEPDLHRNVSLRCLGNGRVRCVVAWDDTPQPLPDLPPDVIERGLFPSRFPSRISDPSRLQCRSVLDLPRRGATPETGGSPWTEVAMHLVEELQPGRY